MHDPVPPAGKLRRPLWLVIVFLLAGLAGCRGPLGSVLGSSSQSANPAIQAELRSLQSAQNVYMAGHDHYACTMAELGNQFGLIDRQLAYGHKDGYNFDISCSSNINPSYEVWATPMETGLASPPSYCIDHSGQMRQASNRLDHCRQGRPVE